MPRLHVDPFSDGVVDAKGVPFYHKLKRPMNAAELQLLKENEVELESGRLSEKERGRVRKNLRRYRREYDVAEETVSLLLGLDTAIDRTARVDAFRLAIETAFLPRLCESAAAAVDGDGRAGEQLPQRSGNCIYMYARSLYRTDGRGASAAVWSAEDDERLVQLHATLSEKWKQIGKLMGRDGESARLRFVHLHCNRDGRFSEAERNKLVDAVRQVTAENDAHESAVAMLRVDHIDWKAVAQLVSPRDARQCKKIWMHVRKRLLGQEGNTRVEHFLALMEKMSEQNVSREKLLDWNALAEAAICPSLSDAASAKTRWWRFKYEALAPVSEKAGSDFTEFLALAEEHVEEWLEAQRKFKRGNSDVLSTSRLSMSSETGSVE